MVVMLKQYVKFILILTALSTVVQAQPEAQYVLETCQGQVEYRLPDNTRVDCLTDSYAIEYDFSHKWAEAVGQSLHYARMTGKRAGIVLIGSQDDAGYKRAFDVIRAYRLPITLNSLSVDRLNK